jgi:hypothetical protein
MEPVEYRTKNINTTNYEIYYTMTDFSKIYILGVIAAILLIGAKIHGDEVREEREREEDEEEEWLNT